MNGKRRPTPPGEILALEFLEPLGITQSILASHLGCNARTIHRLVKGQSRVSAALALKLAAVFNTTPEFWLNLQKAVDLFDARTKLKRCLPTKVL